MVSKEQKRIKDLENALVGMNDLANRRAKSVGRITWFGLIFGIVCGFFAGAIYKFAYAAVTGLFD